MLKKWLYKTCSPMSIHFLLPETFSLIHFQVFLQSSACCKALNCYMLAQILWWVSFAYNNTIGIPYHVTHTKIPLGPTIPKQFSCKSCFKNSSWICIVYLSIWQIHVADLIMCNFNGFIPSQTKNPSKKHPHSEKILGYWRWFRKSSRSS